MALRLADGVAVSRAGTQLLFEVGDDEFVIDSQPVADRVEQWMSRLDAGTDRTSLVADDDDRDFAGDLLDALVEYGVLCEHDSAVPVATTVLVAGTTPWAVRCRDLLLAAGVGAVTADVGLVDDADLVVDLAERRSLAERCWRAGVPSIAGAFDHRGFVIGPLTVPPNAGCWLCAQRRHSATRSAEVAQIAADSRVLARGSTAIDAALAGDLLARAARDILVGAPSALPPGRLVVHDLDTGAGTGHVFVPVDGCPVCCDGARSQPSGEEWVDSGYGVVRGLTEHHTGLLWTVLATCSLPLDTDGMPMRQRAECTRGAGATAEGARLRAIGEAVERHAAASRGDRRIVCASADELPGRCVQPSSLVHYSADQYGWLPYRKPRDTERIAWWPGHDWSGERVWLPDAVLRLYRPPDQCYSQVTSNGVAHGRDVADAAARAVCELVERDAVMTTWQAQQPGCRIDTTSLSNDDREILRWLTQLGYQPFCYAIPAALALPTVLAVAFGDGQHTPGAVIGAATDRDPKAAVRRALWELASNCDLGIAELRDAAGAFVAQTADVSTVDDHAAYYRPARRQEAFAFLDAGGTIDVRDLPMSGGSVAELCTESSVTVFLAPLSATVVRAVSPDLVPLWFGTGTEPRAHPRLRWREARCPHPFT